ncbi:MAG: ribonuclease P protein component [Chloroflexi bacterium RIFCSPLOWO2_12_FULL_71_12]|nr:MAG: ribonuclease P protein component [Chloroflexi bacterium RIFCSPLOWO2_02_FULL_71_16]OGO73324.1 MAG: ribonuclease P protein component [Chloroflexi bacterium RIFCSPLOWO2_12_FULL_71_12]
MRAERLRRTRDIEIVREEGALTVDPHFTIRSKPNALGVIRVAVASPRALGTAVRRNRARRRVREAIRTLVGARRAAPGTDLLVVARAPALRAAPDELRAAISGRLEAVLGPEPS